MYFAEWSSLCFRCPPGSLHSYHEITDYSPSVVIYRCDCSVITNLYYLIPSPFSPEKDFFIKLFFKKFGTRGNLNTYNFYSFTSNFLFDHVTYCSDYAKPSRKFWEINQSKWLAFSFFCYIPLSVMYLHIYVVNVVMIWLSTPSSFNLLNKQMYVEISH